MGIVRSSLFYFDKLPIDILLQIRKAKYLQVLITKNDAINWVFKNQTQSEIDLNIEIWKKRGNDLTYPCKRGGRSFFANTFNIV